MDKNHLNYLKDWLDAEIETLRSEIKRVDDLSKLRNDNTDKATTLARESMEHRLEGMNEFRESLEDLTSTLVTRIEYNKDMDNMKEAIRDLQLSKATLEGKATTSSVYISYVIAFLALGLTIIGFFIR